MVSHLVCLRWLTVPTTSSICNGIMLTINPLLPSLGWQFILKKFRDVDRSIVACNISLFLLICEGNDYLACYSAVWTYIVLILEDWRVPLSMTLLTPLTFEGYHKHSIREGYHKHSIGHGSFLNAPTHYIMFGMCLVLAVVVVVYFDDFFI